MICRDEIETLYRYLDHELSEEEQAEFETHMKSCVNCLRRYYFELHFQEMVIEKLQANEVPPTLVERIRIALRDP